MIDVSGIRKDARIVAGNSNVSLADVAGPAYVKTSFGLVKAQRIGGSLTVESSNGSVNAWDVKGAANIRTSFGSATLDDVDGAVDVYNQNGAIEVSGIAPNAAGSQRCNSISLRTSFAPIRISVPENGSFNVTARTSFGKITSELPLTVSGLASGDSLTGKIGSGACELRLTNGNGAIEIRKAVGRK
jgi:DUF4097 and DUF4098 domain-containing protein YvlB